jgi:tetratricopeptide (TPR) repeat protein
MLRLGLDEEVLAMESGPPFFRLFALLRLGRREEALRLAQPWSQRPGRPELMIHFYHATSQPQRLLDYVETRWADTEQFAAEFPSAPMFGNTNLFQVAHAYRLSGQPEKFEQALALARQAHDRALEDGYDSQFTHFAESSYWAIAGDAEKAMDHLEMALERGGSFPLSDLPLIPEYRGLRLEPRFRELAERAHQRFNEERAVAGLEPLEAEWPL